MGKRIIKYIFIFSCTLFASFLILLTLSLWTFPEWWGSHPLGNNIFLLDWDDNSEIIVLGGSKIGNTCYSGAVLIPDEKNSNSERIVSVKSKAKSILVKTLINNKFKYYVIDLKYDKDKINANDFIKYHIKEVPENIWLMDKQDCLN